MSVDIAEDVDTRIAPPDGSCPDLAAALVQDVESVLAEADWDVEDSTEEWQVPEPAWVAEAYTAALRDDLAAAASAPVGRGTLALLSLLDPVRLAMTARRTGVGRHGIDGDSAGTLDEGEQPAADVEAQAAAGMLLDGVVVAQRLINHVHAIQQRLIAAFCRPGVAFPLTGLVDLAGPAGPATAATDPDNPGQDGQDGTADLAVAQAGVLAQEAVKVAAAEIGCALRLVPVTARMRCENALDLVDHYPTTVAEQQAGDIDPYRARLIAESLAVLPRQLRPAVERRVLPVAATATTARLRRLIDREVIAAHPAAAEARVERAMSDRTVYSRRGENNSGILTAIVSAADAELASATLDALADDLARGNPGEKRTHAQLRADAFTDLFRSLATTGHADITGCAHHPCPSGAADHHTETGPVSAHCPACGHGPGRTGTCASTQAPSASARSTSTPSTPSAAAWCGTVLPSGPTGTVAAYRRPVALNVYLDAATLAGLDERPGELAGYGAITASTARALAASADTIRAILTRPAGPHRTCDNTVLDAGRAVYRPPDRTADYVTVHDKTCAFPGCRAPARRCDLDHRVPFDSGGETCPCNLDALCRTHHRIKTFTAWRATPDPATGHLTWVSPLGHSYPTEQAHLLHDRSRSADRSISPAADASAHEADRDPGDPPPF